MKRLAIASALVLIVSGVVRAEKPVTASPGLGAAISPGELKATPEMWFYDQAMRQYNDPKMAVRAQAEFRTEQRMRRIESLRWFGFSNSRPRVSSDPVHNDYSPSWVSHAGYYPARWNGMSQPWISVTR